MKRILDSISNPYSEENFERLVDLYLSSLDNDEFYKNVVTYYKDRVDTGKFNDPKLKTNFVRVESLPGWIVQRHFSEFFATKHRMYINAPLNHIGTIVDKFVSSCDAQNLPFELKYPCENTERNDTIVIGSCTEAYKSHIEILRKIAEEHPEIVKDCGTPPMLSGVLDGWIGLADENVANRYISYTQSRLDMLKRSINRYICTNPEFVSQIDSAFILETSKLLADRMSNLKNGEVDEDDIEYVTDEVDIYLDNMTLTPDVRKKLSEYITQNPNALKDIYKEFLEECERKNIDSKKPTLYEGSSKEFLDNQTSRKVDITDELRETLNNATSTGVANTYLESNYRDYLSISSKVEIIKKIFGKEFKNRRDELLVYNDLAFLGKIGLISKDSADEFLPEESLDCLIEYIDAQDKALGYLEYDKMPLEQLLKKQSETTLSPNEIKQIIDERKQYIIEYLTAPQLPVSEKKKRIQNDKKLNSEFAKDRYFPFNMRMLLEYQVDLLEDDIEHSEERYEVGKKIAKELQEKNKDDIDTEKVLGKVKPRKSLPEWDLDDW